MIKIILSSAFVVALSFISCLVHASPKFELALEGGLAPFDSKRVIGDLDAVAKIEADAFVAFFGGVSSYSSSDPYKSVFAEGLQAAFLFPVGKHQTRQFVAASVHFNYYNLGDVTANASGVAFGGWNFAESWRVENKMTAILFGIAYGAFKPNLSYRFGIKVGPVNYKASVFQTYQDNFFLGTVLFPTQVFKLDGISSQEYIRLDYHPSRIVGILANVGYQQLSLSGINIPSEKVNGVIANLGVSILFGKTDF